MNLSREAALAILSENIGFPRADWGLWLDYAIRHQFKPVAGESVPACPDCGRLEEQEFGQYVYYSTLIRLRECRSCHFIWADVRLDSRQIRAHFEWTYKGDEYFLGRRRAIFEHMVKLIDQAAPPGGTVLDVGGAQGHLMRLVAERRPDLTATVCDVSAEATRYASEQFGLPVLCADLTALKDHPLRYDLVVLSDVLYYEPQLAVFWATLPRLVANRGVVLIRVPNKLLLIRAARFIDRILAPKSRRKLQDRVRYFNPEHVYIFTRRYLVDRLERAGFEAVRALPSPLLSSGSRRGEVGRPTFFALAEAANALFGHRLVLTPSMVVVARRKGALTSGP